VLRGGTNFGPYVALLGERGLRLPIAVVTDGDPAVDGSKRGETRILELLAAVAQPAELAGQSAARQLVIAADRGFFVGDHTCEVDLFRSGAHEEIGDTLMELAPGNTARTRAQGWRANPATLDPVQFLKDVTAISKGRFAQRLSTRIVAGQCPAYVTNAIEYVRARCARSTPAYRRVVEELRGNPGQLQAYNADRHCVVLAGPGSGKTKTLIVKIARLLIETVREPRGLACITYNAECARELKARLERLGIFESDNIFIGTVHSFCLKKVVMPYAALARIELPRDLRVALPSEQEALFARAVALEISADEPPSRWRTLAEEYRRTHLNRQTAEWQEDEQLAALVARYEGLLRQRGMIDFEDMVLIGLQLIESRRWVRRALRARFPVIVVDEYQDLGVALHRIVGSLCFRGGSRLFAVGDPDQSIYGFTGARPELLRELANSPLVESVRLPFNYRSGPTIVRASEIALGRSVATRLVEERGPSIFTNDRQASRIRRTTFVVN